MQKRTIGLSEKCSKQDQVKHEKQRGISWLPQNSLNKKISPIENEKIKCYVTWYLLKILCSSQNSEVFGFLLDTMFFIRKRFESFACKIN